MPLQTVAYPLTCTTDDNGTEWWFDANGVARCGSLKRRWEARGLKPPHNRCGNPPLEGRNRCNLHGGSSLRGPFHPSFKSGEFSYILKNTNLAKAYQRFESDPDVLNSEREITLTRARIQDLLEMPALNFRPIWEEMEAAFKQARKSYESMNDGGVHAGFQEQARLFDKINEEFARWEELHKAQDLLRRQIVTETARRVKMQEMVRADDFMGFVTRIALAVNQAGTIEEARRDIRRIVDQTLGS